MTDNSPSACEREPIHIPGAIQPHGALVAARIDGLRITHASANLADIIGHSAKGVLGRPLEEVIGPELMGLLACNQNTFDRESSLTGPDGGIIHVRARRSGRHICIDLESTRSEAQQLPSVTLMQSLVESFSRAADRTQLCELAVRGLKEIFGYDRVMAYRFGDDGHGEVIAEACIPQMEPYLGLRYPAGDIPSQARKLYLRQRVGSIADSSYQPVPLLVDPTLDDGTPLDLTCSALRSVSPIHLEYMRNMNTAASLTIALAHGQSLWGMLVCHHATRRIAGPEVRATAYMIGQVVSLLVDSLGDAENQAKLQKRDTMLRAVVDKLASPVLLSAAFTEMETELLNLVDAVGAVVRLSGTIQQFGRMPPLPAAERALDVLGAEAGGELLAINDLSLRYPELGDCAADGSGALLMPLIHGTGDAILWFRPELPRTVTWAGNPRQHVTSDPVNGRLTPRSSFAAWTETTRGRSTSWKEVDLAIARKLRSSITEAIARHHKIEIDRVNKRHQEVNRIRSMRFKEAIDNMAEGLCMYDADQMLRVWNYSFTRLFGIPKDFIRKGVCYRDILTYRIKAARPSVSDLELEQKIETLSKFGREQPASRIEELAHGRLIRISRKPLQGGGWVDTFDDVTDRHRHEETISFMAHHDPLTGLANRAALAEKLDNLAVRLRRHDDAFTVLMLDLDQFKQVNDTLGHPAGDALLQEVASRLKSCLREEDGLARLGGDEFAIIQAGERDQRGASSKLAGRVIAQLDKPFRLEGSLVHIGASIGIALAPEHSTKPDELMKMADMALYSAKGSGRNCYRIFGPEMTEALSRRQELENDLRRAIENDELILHYQPIIDTKTRKMRGAEALIRWHHPTRGMIAPDQFIPLAEEVGLISEIGEWVLHTACVEAMTWPAHVKIAINLSVKQFGDANLANFVNFGLAATGLPPDRLEFEITETALIESDMDVLPVLRQFKKLGISIALDDFGTGYSSLSQLTMFPFDKIKIDKSFTQNMTKRADCAAIISATMTLAQGLNMETTAEGVETADQYRLLRLAGVTSLQGYLFKRPGPASELDFGGVYGDQSIEKAA